MCKTKKEAEPRARRSLPASSSFISHLPDAKQLESISEIDHSLSPSFSYSLPSHKKSLLTEFGIVGWRREREKERKRRFLPLSAKENAPFLRIREEISDRTERAQQPAGPASGGGSGAISMHGFAPEMEPFPFPSPESRSLLFFHRKVRRKLFKLFAFKAGMLSWFPSIAHLGTGPCT